MLIKHAFNFSFFYSSENAEVVSKGIITIPIQVRCMPYKNMTHSF